MIAQRINTALRPVPGWVVYPLGLVPLAALVWGAFSGGLGVDPVKAIEQTLGLRALQFIVVGLAITPLRRFAGVNLIRFRRSVGLMAFLYVALHLATWILLDLQMRWAEIGADLTKRPYIIVGMVGFAALLPLAVTSNNLSIRKMGPLAWQRLHRLVYLAAFAGALHYLMLVKAISAQPASYAVLVLGLLALRVVPKPRTRASHRA